MRADLIAVQELENDGFGPASAAVALLDLLNSSGNSDWRVVDPGAGPIGGDVITVGIYFRQSVFEPVGEPQVLTGPEFTGLSRQPLAQNFRHRASGRHLLVVSHHLKSKGRCPDSGEDVDAGDGQGCWNAARVSAVRAQFPWIREVSRAGGTDNILVLGDMNAWRLEDPIAEFRAGGLVDLVEKISGLPQQSYVYWGQAGTLDYAFATPELAAFAVRAQNWNINSGWPRRMELAPPWLRVSDHDPVVVDFAFSHSETSD
jgi:predicted extracellular nuclease